MRRVKFLRIDRRLSQRKVSSLIGMSQSQLSCIESGRVNPTAAELEVLGRVLNCLPERLLDHVSAVPGREAVQS